MADKKQQKRKDRERRVAREKLDAAAVKRAAEKEAGSGRKTVSIAARKISEEAAAKAEYEAAQDRAPAVNKRVGG